MKIIYHSLSLILLLVFLVNISSYAGGISVDAGLTPGQDRWMLRTQYRYMNMENTMMRVDNHVIPLIVAYGLTPDITLMTRLMYVNRIIDQNTRLDMDGWNDPFFLVKYKVYRKNTSAWVLGVAPYAATNIPVGDKSISQHTWKPELGVNASFRPRFWSIDLNAAWLFNDLTEKLQENTNDQLSLNMAVSSTIPLGSSLMAVSPVIEMTYLTDIQNREQTSSGQQVLFLSPGVVYIYNSFMMEVLYQYPVYQQAPNTGMESGPRLISGLRYMF